MLPQNFKMAAPVTPKYAMLGAKLKEQRKRTREWEEIRDDLEVEKEEYHKKAIDSWERCHEARMQLNKVEEENLSDRVDLNLAKAKLVMAESEIAAGKEEEAATRALIKAEIRYLKEHGIAGKGKEEGKEEGKEGKEGKGKVAIGSRQAYTVEASKGKEGKEDKNDKDPLEEAASKYKESHKGGTESNKGKGKASSFKVTSLEVTWYKTKGDRKTGDE